MVELYEDERNKGYGNDLYNKFENFCLENYATGIILESDSAEEQINGFDLDNWYISMGFEIIDNRGQNNIMYKEL